MKQPSSIRNYARLQEAGMQGANASSCQNRKIPTAAGGVCSGRIRKVRGTRSEADPRVNDLLAEPGPKRRTQTALGLDKTDNAVEAFALPEIGHDEWPLASHPPGIGIHFFQRGTDMGREVDLVDDEEIRSGDAGAAFRGNLVAGRDVDHVDRQIGEFG